MVELLIALAVLGILMTIAALTLRAPSPRLAANNYKATLQEARMEAVKRNRAVIVAWDADEQAVVVKAITDPGKAGCDAAAVELSRLDLSQYRGVTFTTDMPSGSLVWLPNGRSRQCNGALTSTTTTFAGKQASFAVQVSSIGNVEVAAK